MAQAECAKMVDMKPRHRCCRMGNQRDGPRAGEIILTGFDRDGTRLAMTWVTGQLLKISVPVIASGGAGS